MQEQIKLLLQEFSYEKLRPDNSPFLAIDLKESTKISQQTGLSLYEVDEYALRAGITPSRYARNQRVLSIADQLALHQARVAIIGLGGLGGGVTELLARIGIGNMTLIDGDVFDETNLNRQLLCTVSHLGVAKADVAGKRVHDLNPAIRFQTHNTFLGDENSTTLLAHSDIAVDCLDTITARFSLERGCKTLKIPMVSSAIAGKSGQATTIFPETGTLTNLYGQESEAPQRGVEAGLGTLGFTAAYMASIECAEVVNLVLGLKSPLQAGLLFSDLSDYTVEKIQFQ